MTKEQRLDEAVDGGEGFYLIVGLVDGVAQVGAAR